MKWEEGTKIFMGQIFLSVDFSIKKLKEIHSPAMYLLCLISEIMGIAKAYTKILASQLLRFIFFYLNE